MKLKKLLLPLASIGSTSCIIMPIITSCGGYSQSFKATFYHDGTQNKYYQSTIEQKTGTIDRDKYEETYFADVQQNIDILFDDIFYYNFGGYEPEDTIINDDDKYETTTTKSLSLTITDFSAVDKCMSGTLKQVVKKKTISTEDRKYLYIYKQSSSYNFKDLPIKFFKDIDEGKTYYKFIFDKDKLEYNDYCSIRCKSNTKRHGKDKNGVFISSGYSEDYIIDKESPELSFDELKFVSHYFNNIA